MTFAALGKPEAGRSGNKPNAHEWRNDVWSVQWAHTDKLSESELRDALAGIEWLRECVRYLTDVGGLIRDEKLGDDVKLPWQEAPWWMPEWGDPETAILRVRDVKVPDSV
ncbi:hypothetical protein [Nocardia sp. NPDC004260]